MRKMKDSGIEWIGDIPENWSKYRLRFLCKITTGDKDTVNREDDGLYPFFVRSPKVEHINSYSYDGEAVLMAGDGVGAGKVFHYVNGKFDYHQRVYNLHKFKYVVGKYLYYYLKENFYREIEKSNAKSTVDSIRLPMILDFKVVCGDINEQKKIIDYLDKKCASIDSIIDKEQKLIEKLKEYKQSRITETVTKGLNPDAPMKDSGVEWIGDIPKHWNINKLKNIVKHINVKQEYQGFYYIGLENIESWTGKIFDYNVKNKEEIDSVVNSFNKQSILFCKLRPYLAKVAMPTFDGQCSTELLSLLPTERINKHFLFWNLISKKFIDIVNSSTYGTKMPRANWEFIKNLYISCPSVLEQQKIADYLDEKCSKIDENISKRQTLIEKLTEYKKSLIYEVVTGKIEIQ